MHRPLAALSLLFVSAFALPLAGDPPAVMAHQGSRAQTYVAVTRPVHTYRLAPPVNELVQSVLVQPGDMVSAGQPLVTLRDLEAKLQVELLTLRAKSTLRIDAAKAAWDVSVLEEAENRNAMGDGAVLEPEMRRVELRTERDRLLYEQTLQEQRDLRLQLQRAQALLDRYTMRAPAPGQVVAVHVEPGESPDNGRPIVEIVDTSSLRVELGVPAADSIGLMPEQSATVRIEYPDGSDAVLAGEVTFVSPLIDIGAGARDDQGLRMVHLIAPNPDGYPAGTLATISFTPAR